MTIFCATLYLNRFAYLPQCTLGKLSSGVFKIGTEFSTLERPWIRNPSGPGGKHEESCVPDGEYTLVPHNTQSKPNTFELVNPLLGVFDTKPQGQDWGRDQVLIHIANYVSQLLGCIAVGQSFVWSVVPSILESTTAMTVLRRALKDVGFSWETPAKLIIQPSKGTLS